jgi:hypothetical protein
VKKNASLYLSTLLNGIFLLFVPVLDLRNHGLEVNVGHVEVRCKLAAVIGFSGARGTRDKDLHRLETPLLAEFFLGDLDVGSKPIFAMPIEIHLTCGFFSFNGRRSDKE